MDNYERVREALDERNLTASDFLDVITNWLGTQILDDDFMEYLENEGILD